MFIDFPRKKRGTSAYYELQFCKSASAADELAKGENISLWQEDSLYFHMDDDERFFKDYGEYFASPLSPDGSGTLCYFGINYYTREKTREMLRKIEAERPAECEILLPWLQKAAEKYNGFYLLGI